MSFFIAGHFDGSATCNPGAWVPNDGPLSIGMTADSIVDDHGFAGYIDEVRISDVARY